MEELVNTLELMIYSVIFVLSAMMSWFGEVLTGIDAMGRVLFTFIGVFAGFLLIDTLLIRRRQSQQELKNSKRNDNP